MRTTRSLTHTVALAALLVGALLAGNAVAASDRLQPGPRSRLGLEAADQTLGVAIMSAVVRSNGDLDRGTGAVSSARVGGEEGFYEVIFNRNVQNCTYVATPEPFAGGADVHAEPRSTDVNGVFVTTFDGTGAQEDVSFNLIVFCHE